MSRDTRLDYLASGGYRSGRIIAENGDVVNAADFLASAQAGGGQVRTAFDSGTVDAFGRLRVSNPVTLFASQMQYDKQPLLWVEKSVGTAAATHRPFESATDLEIGTASGDRMVRQTREYIPYQPGKSQLVLLTGTFGPGQVGTEKLIGYGDDKNGIFVGQDGGGMFILLRSNTTGTPSDARKVYQADWSVDTFDATGVSGETLDPTKAQIILLDIEWLGVGRVRVGFVIDGSVYYAHEFMNANRNQTTTYMTTANLPVRYEIKNTAAVDAAPSLKQVCCSVSSEGGTERVLDYPFSTLRTDVAIPTGPANAIVVFAARHALTFNGTENRGQWTPKNYEVAPIGGRVVTQIVYNPDLVGGTWAAIDSRSFIEGSTNVSSFTNGIVIESSIGSGGGVRSANPLFGDTFNSRLPFGLDIDGANPIPLALIAYALENNVTASFTFQWEELR